MKNDCCASFKKKGKACKGCPFVEVLAKRDRKKLLKKYRKRHERKRAA